MFRKKKNRGYEEYEMKTMGGGSVLGAGLGSLQKNIECNLKKLRGLCRTLQLAQYEIRTVNTVLQFMNDEQQGEACKVHSNAEKSNEWVLQELVEMAVFLNLSTDERLVKLEEAADELGINKSGELYQTLKKQCLEDQTAAVKEEDLPQDAELSGRSGYIQQLREELESGVSKLKGDREFLQFQVEEREKALEKAEKELDFFRRLGESSFNNTERLEELKEENEQLKEEIKDKEVEYLELYSQAIALRGYWRDALEKKGELEEKLKNLEKEKEGLEAINQELLSASTTLSLAVDKQGNLQDLAPVASDSAGSILRIVGSILAVSAIFLVANRYYLGTSLSAKPNVVPLDSGGDSGAIRIMLQQYRDRVADNGTVAVVGDDGMFDLATGGNVVVDEGVFLTGFPGASNISLGAVSSGELKVWDAGQGAREVEIERSWSKKVSMNGILGGNNTSVVAGSELDIWKSVDAREVEIEGSGGSSVSINGVSGGGGAEKAIDCYLGRSNAKERNSLAPASTGFSGGSYLCGEHQYHELSTEFRKEHDVWQILLGSALTSFSAGLVYYFYFRTNAGERSTQEDDVAKKSRRTDQSLSEYVLKMPPSSHSRVHTYLFPVGSKVSFKHHSDKGIITKRYSNQKQQRRENVHGGRVGPCRDLHEQQKQRTACGDRVKEGQVWNEVLRAPAQPQAAQDVMYQLVRAYQETSNKDLKKAIRDYYQRYVCQRDKISDPRQKQRIEKLVGDIQGSRRDFIAALKVNATTKDSQLNGNIYSENILLFDFDFVAKVASAWRAGKGENNADTGIGNAVQKLGGELLELFQTPIQVSSRRDSRVTISNQSVLDQVAHKFCMKAQQWVGSNSAANLSF
jgi:hypothetical protein